MRILSVFIVMLFAVGAKAQTMIPSSFTDYQNRSVFTHRLPLSDSNSQKKWSFSKYAGLSVGYSFFKGGNAAVVAAPFDMQVNRKLTNTLYAFGGVMLAPAYVNFSSLPPAGTNKIPANNFQFTPSNLTFSSRAELGLMYVSPERTFSISGSVGVERSNYPVYYNQLNGQRQLPVGVNR